MQAPEEIVVLVGTPIIVHTDWESYTTIYDRAKDFYLPKKVKQIGFLFAIVCFDRMLIYLSYICN